MSGDVCDRFPVPVPEVPVEDEESEVEEPCDGCEEYRIGVRDGLCPKCAREWELTQMARDPYERGDREYHEIVSGDRRRPLHWPARRTG